MKEVNKVSDPLPEVIFGPLSDPLPEGVCPAERSLSSFRIPYPKGFAQPSDPLPEGVFSAFESFTWRGLSSFRILYLKGFNQPSDPLPEGVCPAFGSFTWRGLPGFRILFLKRFAQPSDPLPEGVFSAFGSFTWRGLPCLSQTSTASAVQPCPVGTSVVRNLKKRISGNLKVMLLLFYMLTIFLNFQFGSLEKKKQLKTRIT
jgi:hypothetical protein